MGKVGREGERETERPNRVHFTGQLIGQMISGDNRNETNVKPQSASLTLRTLYKLRCVFAFGDCLVWQD